MILQIILLLVGFALLIYGAEILVRGASSIATNLGMSPILVGLTVVAFGTSAPELFVSVEAALFDKVDVAVGNIVGSNICNILAIVGVAILVKPLKIDFGVRRKDSPLMLLTALVFWLISLNNEISRIEGVFLLAGIIAYLLISYKQHKNDLKEETSEEDLNDKGVLFNTFLILVGLAGLVFGADLIVKSAVFIAKIFHVSDLVIGITVVAFGTSLPEFAATVIAARKNQGNMALGNALGSNVFNVLCVIGITSIIKPLPVIGHALNFDIPFMFFSCLLVSVLLWYKEVLGKFIGVMLLLIYLAYVTYLAIGSQVTV